MNEVKKQTLVEDLTYIKDIADSDKSRRYLSVDKEKAEYLLGLIEKDQNK